MTSTQTVSTILPMPRQLLPWWIDFQRSTDWCLPTLYASFRWVDHVRDSRTCFYKSSSIEFDMHILITTYLIGFCWCFLHHLMCFHRLYAVWHIIWTQSQWILCTQEFFSLYMKVIGHHSMNLTVDFWCTNKWFSAKNKGLQGYCFKIKSDFVLRGLKDMSTKLC